ncbi:MAG: MFS transporter [Pseudomonadales bacterium]|jgi:predicted MFS family arabinose efflux permease|uniref:YbfB/YjiJ family MFS transporter n=1 Tax=Halopseudomonas TaxID=2901189 RepID=UPI000C49861E|nr:YbfB/YjiJ family MFS transporter [Halopseudomonas aestusnigri]MAK74127.1 MFS transporter [Pseudomonadales bacterium]MEE2800348.1 YbfB/YjiJ family MFS transporter [Pseudomonadota bacterium]MAP75979.1 MFS transporter [Pseudomonadales bacterium]MAY07429.1 MFS transporter [Pseudomonadales bacterium]MBP76349.1 MFS transporter [Pseudomonadales bacterium]|tara:strand:- start:5417 stop:6595 length:1179 start_codon:yes stop_codon:yes gene_type:complete
MPTRAPSILQAVAAAAILLLVVHGLGRFIFTPLLPLLVGDGQLTTSQGASLATWNYIGYLIGALIAIRWHQPAQIARTVPAALALHCLTLLGLALTDRTTGISVLRLGNGVSNGLIFVMVPALVMEWLAARQRINLSGLIYLGVGAGLLVSGVLANPPGFAQTAAARWWPAALLSLPLALWGGWIIVRLRVGAQPAPSVAPTASGRSPLLDKQTRPLFFAYAGAGLGYILPMTFLPMIASIQLGEAHPMVHQSWLIVACTTLPAAWLWNHLGQRLGDQPALMINYATQLASVVFALLLPGVWGIALCSLLMGSSFLGAVLLTQRLGRSLQPHQGPRLSAALIALYSVTQLIGPWLAHEWLGRGGVLPETLWLGAGALLWSLIWTAKTPQPDK